MHTYADIHLSISFKTIFFAKGNTGGSNHYWREKKSYVLIKKEDIKGLTVQFPNNSILTLNQKGAVPLSTEFTKEGKNTIIFLKLKSASLILLEQLCNENYNLI